MSWQYALPLNVHPRSARQRRIVFLDILNPCDVRRTWSCSAVVSSSDRIFSSTMVFISGVITVGLPEPGHLMMVPDCLYLPISLAMPTLEATMSSSSSKHAIDQACYRPSTMALFITIDNSLLCVPAINHFKSFIKLNHCGRFIPELIVINNYSCVTTYLKITISFCNYCTMTH